ncbi:MAG: SIR2 family protein [Polyangiaceae bacterium]|nr:SIR2 family protein [Polyangiaceae bacterium]
MDKDERQRIMAACLKPRYNEYNLALKVAEPPAHDRPYALLLGAGASASSGIPTAGKMIADWRHQLFEQHHSETSADRNEQAYQAWLGRSDSGYLSWLNEARRLGETEYSTLFSHFHQDRSARQIHIESLMKKGFPSWGFLYLSGLIAAGRFNRILTTNFDDLVAEALFRFYDIKAIELSFDAAIASVRFDSDRPKILKLHGDFLYDNLRNLRDELKRLDREMEDRLFRACADAGLIVVGYSGGDTSILGPIREMLRSDHYLRLGLHWCVTASKSDGAPYIADSVLHLAREHPEKVFLYTIKNFDGLMREMFLKCECGLPPAFIDPHKKNLLKRFLDSARHYGDAVPHPATVTHQNAFIRAAALPQEDLELTLVACENEWAEATHLVQSNPTLSLQKAEEARLLLERIVMSDKFLTQSDEFRLRAYNRGTGNAVTLAETSFLLGAEAETDRHIASTIDFANQAIQIESANSDPLITARIRHVAYYNASVASGLRDKHRAPLTAAEENDVRAWLAALRRIDPDGQYRRDLIAEANFETLRRLLPSDW